MNRLTQYKRALEILARQLTPLQPWNWKNIQDEALKISLEHKGDDLTYVRLSN